MIIKRTGKENNPDLQVIIRTVGMATNKVAMEMMVLKWMQRGLLSQLDSTNYMLIVL